MKIGPEQLPEDDDSGKIIGENPDNRPSLEKIREIKIENNTLVLIVGLPGSGKSTFAVKHFPLDAIVSTDRLRQEMSNNPGNQVISGRAFAVANEIVDSRLSQGKIVVVDAQNLAENNRVQFYQLADRYDAKVVAIFLDVNPDQSIERDNKRNKKTGSRYIKIRKSLYELTQKTIHKDSHIDELHVVAFDEVNNVSVSIPEEYKEDMDADRKLLGEAGRAEMLISGLEDGFTKREIKESMETISIKAGSALFIEGSKSDELKKFIDNNFLPHQVIDVGAVAKRLAVDVNNEAIFYTIKAILGERMYRNLTTCIIHEPDFIYRDKLIDIIRRVEEKRKIEITSPRIRVEDGSGEIFSQKEIFTGSAVINRSELVNYQIDVRRDAPDDVPLFIVGDVHGAYTAMREIASRIRQENLERDESSQMRRKIVFVGDMADRGPYSTETVIYITSLVRQGRAILVKGNHDENLLRGLRGEQIKSQDTQKTVEELKKRLKPESINKIIEVLENAPYYEEWKHLVVVHASLPRIPRIEEGLKFNEEVIDNKAEGLTEEEKIKIKKAQDRESKRKIMSHGARSGEFAGGRAEVWSLHNTVAKDPDILVVGGHTHEQEPVMNMVAGTTILDGSIELKGRLWGMYYPELELASAQEPTIARLYEVIKSGVMPEGNDLLTFIEYLEIQGLVEIKRGHGKYENLTLVTYSGYTELMSAWDEYPVLRNFRGLIVDGSGNIVARPFEKTHKAGIEISLDKLNIIPDKVFEKANGSLGIVYFWGGKWQVATKFSFENENYTKPSREMLSKMNMGVLDPDFTYLFEIILPEDSHVVDYAGQKDLVLLNAINTKTGETKDWEDVSDVASKLGARTAEDMTERFKGMTIAQIYAYAQEEGNIRNLEGLMAQYTDENGKKVMVKVKAKEYDDKKFVRDRLDWEKIIEAFDKETLEVSPEKFEALLSYNVDNNFARAALEARIQWINGERERLVLEVIDFMFEPLSEAELLYHEGLLKLKDKGKALENALKMIALKIRELLKGGSDKFGEKDLNVLMSILRAVISGEGRPERVIAKYAVNKIIFRIEEEKKKKGKNSFWIVPS